MIKCMTGFGRCEAADAERKITVEMKSVNHRYLDVSMKMPKKLNYFEAAIRGTLKEYIQRGKVDLFLSYEDFTENGGTVRYSRETAAEYLRYLRQMAEEFSLKDDITSASSEARTSRSRITSGLSVPLPSSRRFSSAALGGMTNRSRDSGNFSFTLSAPWISISRITSRPSCRHFSTYSRGVP